MFGMVFRSRSCSHLNMTSHLDLLNGLYVHKFDECRDCGWKSPVFDSENTAVEFYAKKLKESASE